MKQIHFTLSIFILLLVNTTATAATDPQITGYKTGNLTIDKSYKYQTTLLDESLSAADNPAPKILQLGYRVDLDYVFKWKLSILMGEPVVIGWLAYKPTNISPYNSALFFETFQNNDLFKKIRVSEFKMKVHMFLKPTGQRAFDKGATLVIDAGSAGTPYLGHSSRALLDNTNLFKQFHSFNVSGSPNWDKLFTNIEDKQQAKKYFIDLTSAARKRDRYYASYYKHKIFKIEVDTSAIDKHIYNYLKTLEKEIKTQQNKENREAKKIKDRQANELEAALADTEASASEKSDLLSDEASGEVESFEDLLEETEKIKLTINAIPHIINANVITVSGKVENVSSIDSSEIVFQVNGLEQPVYLARDGSFSNKVVLFNGENQIDINYSSAAKNESKTIHVKSNTPPVKARFTLTWDNGSSDMDLHVYGPDGDHCSYGNKTTSNMRLDVDNTSGYGPENVSVKLNQHPGTYRVDIKHYGGNSGNVTLYVYLDNRLVATERSHLSGSTRWHAYDLEIN